MRVMVLVKANKDSEAGILPEAKLLEAMGKFNQELVKAGVMLAGEGLRPSSNGVRVKFAGKEPLVTDGPFAETKELIAGFWLWKVNDMQDAIQWLKRSPFGAGAEIEIRQLHEAEDFAPVMTPEVRAQEEKLRAQIKQQSAGNQA